ncbi:hypothetical protein FRC12_007530 [Ceratobasidium sp. 428]|nr:hypothetical protein FRC12_007530 [Ceratobasidium sp. 428]
MRISGLVLISAAVGAALGGSVSDREDERVVLALGDPGVNLWTNGTAVHDRKSALFELWPDVRLRRFLELRGRLDERVEGLSHAELTSLAQSSLSTPIITSPTSPHLASFTSSQCGQLTVDQLVHWTAHHSGRRVNSHGANVFDAPPTKVRSRAKRVAAVELCERIYRERVLGMITPPRRDSSKSESDQEVMGEEKLDVEQQRLFASQIAQAEAAPHAFEPEINSALDRAAKHSIHDLRDLLDVFGVRWTEDDLHAHLTELAKAHTALWIGRAEV